MDTLSSYELADPLFPLCSAFTDVQQELPYNAHWKEAAENASQSRRLCEEIQQKLELVQTIAPTIHEAWRDMRAAIHHAEEQLKAWMTNLG